MGAQSVFSFVVAIFAVLLAAPRLRVAAAVHGMSTHVDATYSTLAAAGFSPEDVDVISAGLKPSVTDLLRGGRAGGDAISATSSRVVVPTVSSVTSGDAAPAGSAASADSASIGQEEGVDVLKTFPLRYRFQYSQPDLGQAVFFAVSGTLQNTTLLLDDIAAATSDMQCDAAPAGAISDAPLGILTVAFANATAVNWGDVAQLRHVLGDAALFSSNASCPTRNGYIAGAIVSTRVEGAAATFELDFAVSLDDLLPDYSFTLFSGSDASFLSPQLTRDPLVRDISQLVNSTRAESSRRRLLVDWTSGGARTTQTIPIIPASNFTIGATTASITFDVYATLTVSF